MLPAITALNNTGETIRGLCRDPVCAMLEQTKEEAE
jgi:hypothetical protein